MICILFNCSDNKSEEIKNEISITNNKFENSKDSFILAVSEFEKCKSDYEINHNHKIKIDIRNGSGKSGVAKEFSDYLRNKCYDTHYGNWITFDESKTYLILHKIDTKMANEIVEQLDNNIQIETVHNLEKLEDVTLIIGRDYSELDFYKKRE